MGGRCSSTPFQVQIQGSDPWSRWAEAEAEPWWGPAPSLSLARFLSSGKEPRPLDRGPLRAVRYLPPQYSPQILAAFRGQPLGLCTTYLAQPRPGIPWGHSSVSLFSVTKQLKKESLKSQEKPPI